MYVILYLVSIVRGIWEISSLGTQKINTVNSPLSSMYRELDLTVMWIYWWEKLLQKHNTESQHVFALCICWSLASGLMGERFWIHVTVTALMVPAWGRTAGSAAGGGWENYHMAGEHMHIANLFLSNIIKMIVYLSWNFLPAAWEFQMPGYQITGSMMHIPSWYFKWSHKCFHIISNSLFTIIQSFYTI
jgi:hypothetical protein